MRFRRENPEDIPWLWAVSPNSPDFGWQMVSCRASATEIDRFLFWARNNDADAYCESYVCADRRVRDLRSRYLQAYMVGERR